jgi:hypothetical protein
MNPVKEVFEVEKIIEEGYSVLEAEKEIIPNFSSKHEVLGKNLGDTPFKVMKNFFNSQSLDYVTSFVNKRLELKLEALNPTTKRRYLYAPTTNDDNLACIAITILCEHQKSLECSSNEAQFKKVIEVLKAQDVNVPFGYQRYETIYEATIPSKQELQYFVEIMNPIFLSLVDTSNLIHLCVDETLYETEPRMINRQRSDPVKERRNNEKLQDKRDIENNKWSDFIVELGLWPVVHINGKPHDGLFLTGLCAKSTTTNMPFLLSFVPYLGETQSTLETLRFFASRFPADKELTFTLDSRFSSFDNFFSIISEFRNVKILQSMKSNSKPYLWNAMKASTNQNKWKVLHNAKQDFIVSLKKLSKKDEGRNYLLLTNAFKPSSSEINIDRDEVWDGDALRYCFLYV